MDGWKHPKKFFKSKQGSILAKAQKRPLFQKELDEPPSVHFHSDFLHKPKTVSKYCFGTILFDSEKPASETWPPPLMSISFKYPRNKQISPQKEIEEKTILLTKDLIIIGNLDVP